MTNFKVQKNNITNYVISIHKCLILTLPHIIATTQKLIHWVAIHLDVLVIKSLHCLLKMLHNTTTSFYCKQIDALDF